MVSEVADLSNSVQVPSENFEGDNIYICHRFFDPGLDCSGLLGAGVNLSPLKKRKSITKIVS
jgi:hypothetical protein